MKFKFVGQELFGINPIEAETTLYMVLLRALVMKLLSIVSLSKDKIRLDMLSGL